MYKRLEIVNYEDYKNYDKEYKIRYNSPAVLKTGLSIHPFNKRQQKRLPESYQLFYLPLPKHISMIEQIYKMSAKLSSFSLSNILTQKLFYSQIIDEIQSTNDMEGVKSTRKEINEAYISPSKTKRFSGIVGMYKSIVDNKFEKIDVPMKFRVIYDQLFLDEMPEDKKPDGRLFRKEIIFVGDGSHYVHQGDPSEDIIDENLTKLILFMNKPEVPIVIKAIITHYFFEYVHPFYDGNGRMGRYLLSSYLARKLDFLTGLSISESVLQNKRKYEEGFSITSQPKNKGDLTPFVDALLEIIVQAQKNILSKLSRLTTEVERLKEVINKLSLTEQEKDILFILGQDKLFDLLHTGISNKQLVEVFEGKYKRTKIDTITKKLEEKKLVVKIKSSPIVYEINETLLDDFM